MTKSAQSRVIPTELSLERFQEFVLPRLTTGRRGPAPKLSLHALFNYILKQLYMGCQWKELPIEKTADGRRKFIIPGYMACSGGGRRTGVSMQYSKGPCRRFIGRTSSTSRSFTATARRPPRRREATMSDSVLTKRSKGTRLLPFATETAMSSRLSSRHLAIAMNRRCCVRRCQI